MPDPKFSQHYQRFQRGGAKRRPKTLEEGLGKTEIRHIWVSSIGFTTMEKLLTFVDSGFKIKEPGFCAKTHTENNGAKCFINFCHSNAVSPPTLILSENDLQNFIENQKYEELSKFTIPLVLEKLETTKDKKGHSASVTHAIVNSKFYRECISSSDIYKGFLIYVTIESINAKFNVKIDHSSYVILQNKHYQLPDNQSAFNKFIDSFVDSKVLSAENENSSSPTDKLSSVDQSTDDESKNMDPHANVRINLDVKHDLVEMAIKLEEEANFDDLSLQLNEDHVVLKHKGKVVNDFFISVPMQYDQASASLKSNILRIKCPICL